MSRLPARVQRLEEARALHGDLIDRLSPWLFRADPEADAAIDAIEGTPNGMRMLDRAIRSGVRSVDGAPEALVALFRSLDTVPVWVDRERADRAGRLLFRAGPIGAIVLGARSLAAGYCSPAGNKPLVMTGQLTSASRGQRLAETGRFVTAVCAPGGLQRDQEGFALCVRVRMMHAKVRWLIARSGRWDDLAYGAPINQHDLLATSLLFSQVFTGGLRAFGLVVTPEEASDWLHLWRWASVLLGVDISLLPTDESHAERLISLIRLTQGEPDEDSRRLVRSILDSPDARSRPGGVLLAEGFCRALLGDELADSLQLSRTPYRHAVRAIAAIARPLDELRARHPRIEQWCVEKGEQRWKAAIAQSAAGPLRFSPPGSLAG